MDQDEDEDYSRLFDDDNDNDNDVGLFNPSHSDNENNKENDADADAIKAMSMIDNLFGEILDGKDPFADARAAAEKKHANYTYISSTPHEVLPSSSPPRGGSVEQSKEKKKPRPQKLDEVLLTSDTGFPALMRDMKGFQLKGKGHETEDLNRLLSRYQFWTQRMYPKSQFRDTVERVEKLCRSRLMHSKMSGWRNEALGISDPVKEEKEDSDNPKKDDAVDDEDESDVPGVDDNVLPPSDGPLDTDVNHSDAAAYASSSPDPPTRPPSSLGVLTDDDFNEEDMRDAQQQDHELDDEDQWAMFDDDEVIPPPPKPKVDDDEFADEFEDVDMDVVMEQVEQKMVAKNNPDPPVPGSAASLDNSIASVAAEAEDEDDIYL